MIERTVRQFAEANENLKWNVLKTILTANKVKEQIRMHEISCSVMQNKQTK